MVGSQENIGVIPQLLLKKDCASVLTGMFDPRGLTVPIKACMKDDKSIPHERGMDWEEALPAELREIWISNFGAIQELGEVKFHSAFVPDDAVSLDITTTDSHDLRSNQACTCAS